MTVRFLFCHVDSFLDLLSASEIAMISMLTGCSLAKHGDKKYMNPLTEIPRFEGWVKTLVEKGHAVRLVGKHMPLLHMKIADPRQFWKLYPKGVDIEVWLMVVNAFAINDAEEVGGPFEPHNTPTSRLSSFQDAISEEEEQRIFIWPQDEYVDSVMFGSRYSYWTMIRQANRLLVWFVDIGWYVSEPTATLGIGLRDVGLTPYNPRNAPKAPDLVEIETQANSKTTTIVTGTTSYLDVSEMIGGKSCQDHTWVNLFFDIHNEDLKRVGVLTIHDDFCTSYINTVWGSQLRITLPFDLPSE